VLSLTGFSNQIRVVQKGHFYPEDDKGGNPTPGDAIKQ
jgi:hypothetical protein